MKGDDKLIDIHPTADVAADAQIGAGTQIWSQVQVREHAHIGEQCRIGKGVYTDAHVHIGANVKIQNHVSLFEGVTLEDDLLPRAITPGGKLKNADEWVITPTLVKYGASIGAGSVVTRDVPAHALVFGNPARQHGYVCRCARRLSNVHAYEGSLRGWCETCGRECSVG
jgi:UDP-2-acetamido-3-amino-2,3-dideoxy-glucuronate N-acetyltransferase